MTLAKHTMVPRYIDSHAHLTFENYQNDIEDVISRAKNAGVRYCVVPGTNLKTSRAAIALAENYECIYAGVGVHPHEVAKMGVMDLEAIEELSNHPKVVAIGEIGLDYHYDFSPREQQKKSFVSQIEIAVRGNLPVIIHTREATNDVFTLVQNMVEAHPRWRESNIHPGRGVFHCFPGTVEDATFVRRLGFYVSYPGIVTFKNSESLKIIKQIGIENVLLETDSPYMTPVPFRGKRNEPEYIIYTGQKIAQALEMTEEQVAQVTTKNTIQLFGLPPLAEAH
jgi:TatD DNase family protein